MMSPEDRIITQLESRITELVSALQFVTLTCENVHHAKRDLHSAGTPCPVVRRIEAVLADNTARDGRGEVRDA